VLDNAAATMLAETSTDPAKKTNTNALLVAQDGKLALDAPVGLAAWQGTNKAAITWRDLLNMAPGLAWTEGSYAIGDDDSTKILFSQEDQCAWAESKPLVVQPGTVFNYSTGFANLGMCRLKELAGGSHRQIYDYYQRRDMGRSLRPETAI